MAAEEKWYFAKKQLENSPSRKCDIDSDKELSYRQQAANFIQDVGQRLQVSQLCINTAIVYMHRFYVFHSFTQFHRYSMASAALFLAAKVEEQPRKLEHVIKVAHLCLHKEAEGTTPATPDVKSEQYAQAAHDLVFNENVLLQTLGFDVAIDHPHTHVVRCCHLVKASKDLAQTSYFLASNSLHLTTMCLQYKPTVVACFCIHLACKWSNWEIPPSSEGKPWFTYVDETVTTEMLDELTKEFISIYNKCPSRLKKKIQSMSASLGQSSGSQSSGNQSSGQGSNSLSPMAADNKKVQSQHSKVHHNQLKPGVAHPHRPPHDANINYNEYKEKKERERQMGAPGSSHGSSMPHHKQPIPGSQPGSSSNSVPQNHKHGMPPSNSSSVPPNRIPHHRSSSSNVDPKLKMHPQMHPQHQQRSSSQGGQSHPSSSHPRMPPSGADARNMDREQLHREQHMRNSNDAHYRSMQMNRDMTAPRDPPPTTSAPIPPSSSNLTSERELLKEQQMRERHNQGGNALHLIDGLNKDSVLRDAMDRSSSQMNNRGNDPSHNKHRPDLFKDLFKESNNSVNSDSINSEKQKYEQKKLLSQTTSVTAAQAMNNAVNKHESSSSRHNRSANPEMKSSSSTHTKPPSMYMGNEQPQVPKKQTITPAPSANMNKSSSSAYPPEIIPTGNGKAVAQQQMRVKPPYTNTSASDSKLSTASPSLTNDHRNGNTVDETNKRPPSMPDTMLSPPPTTYKQKSIFSPEKESPKKTVKNMKTGKTPPTNNGGKKYETVINDISMIPPALSPFGSPPPVAPSTPSSKMRNRTSSSSSEPELMVVIKKLEYEKYVAKDKDNKPGVKVENVPKEKKYADDVRTKEMKVESKEPMENSVQVVNGIDTDPTVISNLLKEAAPPLNHLSVVDIKKEEEISKEIIPQVYETNVPQKSDHHKSDKKKKKDKHKHKDKDRSREDKEKKKKHKDKDRERQKSKEMISESTPVAPLKITIPKDKITPEGGSGLKIKIPKDRIKTDSISNTNQAIGGLKIKISKDKIVENSETIAPNMGGGSTSSMSSGSIRKRDRDIEQSGGPPPKQSKSNSGGYTGGRSSSESARQNGRNSYNNKQQVSLGEGGQVGGVAVGVLQQQAQWSTQVKLAESKYHSKVPGSNKQPPT